MNTGEVKKEEKIKEDGYDKEIDLSSDKVKHIFIIVAGGIILLAIIGFFSWNLNKKIKNLSSPSDKTVKVGILHSLTGPLAVRGSSIVDATLFAIEQINKQGGILGKTVVPIIVDSASDPQNSAKEAERLITEEGVSAIFGCSTTACLRTVESVIEKHDSLLFYPGQCEGLKHTHNLVITGPLPNQQLEPAINWAFKNLGDTFYLVGSDYIYSRTVNEIAKEQIKSMKGRVVEEDYVLLGSGDFDEIADEIVALKPKVILSSVVGDSNAGFFRSLRKAGVYPEEIPIISLSVSEDELRVLGVKDMVGDYAAWNYFQSIDNPENKEFLKEFKERFGSHRVVNDEMESAYVGVNIWARAIKDANNFKSEKIHQTLLGLSFNAPEGLVLIDEENHYMWKNAKIGRIKDDGMFEIVWQSDGPIHPKPYPGYRSEEEWDNFIYELYKNWNETWSNPGIRIEDMQDEINQAQKLISVLASQPAIVSAAKTSSAASDFTLEEITKLNNDWHNSRGQNSLAEQLLNNDAAKALKKIQEVYPLFIEIIATDDKGLNIALTNIVNDYYQGDKDWWVKSYNHGYGSSFNGKIAYEESSRIFGISIYQPIYNEENKAIGVIKAVLDLGQLNARKLTETKY